jgi:hypothetical protein
VVTPARVAHVPAGSTKYLRGIDLGGTFTDAVVADGEVGSQGMNLVADERATAIL